MNVIDRERVAMRVAIPVLLVLWGLGHTREAAAQPAAAAPAFGIKMMKVGDCQVVVQLTPPRGGDRVGVIVELTEYQEQTVIAGRSELAFPIGEPLREGFNVRVRRNGEVVAKAVVPAGGGPPQGACGTTSPSGGTPFFATAFFGTAVDTFAPDKVGDYKNPEAGAQNLQEIFGIDFNYRLFGNDDSRVQFWIDGETMHGVRTADINCKPERQEDIPPVCTKGPGINYPARARYILEHATSLEAFVSPRLEFATLQRGSESPASLYVTARLGFIALKDAPRVYRSFHFAPGLVANAGPFEGSYFEAGVGKNELFSSRWNRLKIDGLLSFSLTKIPVVGSGSRVFVEMMIDNDLKDGPDSVRTFFGVDVNLQEAFGQ